MDAKSTCPLCQRPNHCDVSAASGHCWCFDMKVPVALLARLPEDLRNNACICRECIVAFNTTNTHTAAHPHPLPPFP